MNSPDAAYFPSRYKWRPGDIINFVLAIVESPWSLWSLARVAKWGLSEEHKLLGDTLCDLWVLKFIMCGIFPGVHRRQRVGIWVCILVLTAPCTAGYFPARDRHILYTFGRIFRDEVIIPPRYKCTSIHVGVVYEWKHVLQDSWGCHGDMAQCNLWSLWKYFIVLNRKNEVTKVSWYLIFNISTIGRREPT